MRCRLGTHYSLRTQVPLCQLVPLMRLSVLSYRGGGGGGKKGIKRYLDATWPEPSGILVGLLLLFCSFLVLCVEGPLINQVADGLLSTKIQSVHHLFFFSLSKRFSH